MTLRTEATPLVGVPLSKCVHMDNSSIGNGIDGRLCTHKHMYTCMCVCEAKMVNGFNSRSQHNEMVHTFLKLLFLAKERYLRNRVYKKNVGFWLNEFDLFPLTISI